MKLAMKERAVFRLLGIETGEADDGTIRILFPAKHADLAERSIARMIDKAWTNGTEPTVSKPAPGVTRIEGTKGTVEVKVGR